MAKERQDPVTFGQLAAQVDVVYKGQRKSLVEQLDIALAEAGRHVSVKRGSSSEFVLKVALKRKADEIEIACTLDGKEKNPVPAPFTVFYDQYGLLVPEDPRQIDLPLEAVQPIRKEG